jgi:SAM-dependent methyltransferase
MKLDRMSPIRGAAESDLFIDIYDRAGAAYGAYADGVAEEIGAFAGPHGQADRCVWSRLTTALTQLRRSGATSVRILDSGCGPGAWLRRLVVDAKKRGFAEVVARGYDISEAQIEQARALSGGIAALPGVTLTFDVADLRAPLPEADGSIDIALCLYSVLCHLPAADLPAFAAEIARVTSGRFITTVRSVGSIPTALAETVGSTRWITHDSTQDVCEIEFADGRRSRFPFHLFSASELRACFDGAFDIELIRGLDLFHSRFAIDPRWNPTDLPFGRRFYRELSRLEEDYAMDPQYVDHANHILLVGRREGRNKDVRGRRKWPGFL